MCLGEINHTVNISSKYINSTSMRLRPNSQLMGFAKSIDIHFDTQKIPKTKQKEIEIESIVDDARKGRQTIYLVKRKGLPDSENTWESTESLAKVHHLVEDYESKKKHEISSSDEEPTPKRGRKSKLNAPKEVASVLDPTASFATDTAEAIVGAGRKPNGINVMIKWKGDKDRYSWQDAKECRIHIPDMLLDFYEERVRFP
eukprot:c2390_g1_i1.p1 GENE.c2390_g1_i1~~c2390_g1_i1.p1  ORF type:complete len:201 (+),score=32.35 c2390_g1_i1:153-755(+)